MRHYSFQSKWNIAAPRGKVWHALAATPFSWESWWPQLSELQTITSSANNIGMRFSCVWKAKLGYRLHCTFTVTASSQPREIELSCTGDLSGTARWQLSPTASGTKIAIDWQAQTTKWWMNVFGPLLKPLFIKYHDEIMASGEAGLNRYLQT